MTTHELAAKLLAMEDLPLYAWCDERSERKGEYMPVLMEDPRKVTMYHVNYGGCNIVPTPYNRGNPFSAIVIDIH